MPALHQQMCIRDSICPHSIFGRTVVFGADTELFISATSQYNSDMILTLDGDCVAHMEENEVIQIKRSSLTTKLIKLKHRNFYEVAREKPVSYTHLDVYKRQVQSFAFAKKKVRKILWYWKAVRI